MPIKNKGLKGVLNNLTYDKKTLDQKVVTAKKSMDEVMKVLNGNNKNTK